MTYKYWNDHPFQAVAWLFFSLFTAMIGFAWHKSVFWAIVDFLFPVIVWIKWLICQDVTWPIIKSAFSWFLG